MAHSSAANYGNHAKTNGPRQYVVLRYLSYKAHRAHGSLVDSRVFCRYKSKHTYGSTIHVAITTGPSNAQHDLISHCLRYHTNNSIVFRYSSYELTGLTVPSNTHKSSTALDVTRRTSSTQFGVIKEHRHHSKRLSSITSTTRPTEVKDININYKASIATCA
jgi:hypothetical protein